MPYTYKRSRQEGGKGGHSFINNLTETCYLCKVKIRCGRVIDAITPVWKMADGTEKEGERQGGGGGSEHVFELDKGEYIVTVTGRVGENVDRLTFTTNKGKVHGPYGGTGGHDIDPLENLHVRGFFGRSGERLDAIGFFSVAEC